MNEIVINELPTLYELLLKKIENLYEQFVASKGFFTIALSGGSTPLPLYSLLAKTNAIDFNKVFFFIVDERFVDLNSNDNNYNAINKALFSKIDNNSLNILYIDPTFDTPDESAQDYENKIKNFFSEKGTAPAMDVVLLGIGDDGHTASIFPGDSTLFLKNSICTATDLVYNNYFRITLTADFINKSEYVFFLVIGENKKNAVFKVVQKKAKNLPASHINAKVVNYFLDPLAASCLK